MNAPAPAAVLREALERQEHEFSPWEKMRLSLAARIAGGMCANPNVYTCPNWEGEAARSAMKVADKLLLLHVTGGC